MTTKQPREDLASKVNVLERELAECRRSVEDLKHSEKRLSLIIQSSAIPALVIDKNHMITHCNKAYEKLRGIPAEKMVGTSNQWMTFYKEPSRAMVDYIVDRVPAEEILRHFGQRCRKSALVEGGYEAELFFSSLGESGQWLFFTAAPLISETGEIVEPLRLSRTFPTAGWLKKLSASPRDVSEPSWTLFPTPSASSRWKGSRFT